MNYDQPGRGGVLSRTSEKAPSSQLAARAVGLGAAAFDVLLEAVRGALGEELLDLALDGTS